jgi:hypothetical protein
VAQVERQLAEPRLTPSERFKLTGTMGRLLKLRSDVEHRLLVAADNFTRHPRWQEFRSGLVNALAPFPEARDAVVSVLQRSEAP